MPVLNTVSIMNNVVNRDTIFSHSATFAKHHSCHSWTGQAVTVRHQDTVQSCRARSRCRVPCRRLRNRGIHFTIASNMVKTSGIGWTLRVKVLETGKNAFTWIFRQSFDDERIIEMTLLKWVRNFTCQQGCVLFSWYCGLLSNSMCACYLILSQVWA